MGSRRILTVAGLGALVLILTACATGSDTAPESSDAPAETTTAGEATTSTARTPVETPWTRVLDGIEPDGTVPLDVALDAFALAIGPLPGVDVEDWEPEIPIPGSGPMQWVLGNWDDLTAAQQDAVLTYIPPFDEGEASSEIPLAGIVDSATVFAGTPLAQDADPSWSCAVDSAVANQAASLLAGMEFLFERELSVSWRVCSDEVMKTVFSVPRNASGGVLDGEMTNCEIITTPDAAASLGGWLNFHLAVALFHCFQNDIMLIEQWLGLSPWLIQGSAHWVGAKAVDNRVDTGDLDVGWNRWLQEPARELFSRSADGIGFFALIDEAGLPAAQHIDAMLIAALDGGNEGAYALVADTATVLEEWGPGYFSDPAKGDPWDFIGPMLYDRVPGAHAPFQVTVDNGSEVSMPGIPYAATPVRARLGADVVVVGALGGSQGLEWVAEASTVVIDDLELKATATATLVFTFEEALNDDYEFDSPEGRVYFPDGSDMLISEAMGIAYCTRPGGCECPTGSTGEGRQTRPGQAGEAWFGITGNTEAIDLPLIGYSLQDFCSAGSSGDVERYILTGGEWQWDFQGGTAVNGCVWPSTRANGDITPDRNQYLEFDTSKDPMTYRAFALTTEDGEKTTVGECWDGDTRKYEEFEWTPTGAGGIWIIMDDGPQPVTSSEITGSRTVDNDGSDWTITRTK